MGRWRVFVFGLLVTVILGISAGLVNAATIPYGVLNDVPYNTVVNDWGWSVAYRGDYGLTVSLADVLQNATGDYLMLAAIQDGSTNLELLGAALRTDVLTYTSLNTPHAANGVQWYYNGYSMGFAGLGDVIQQSSADVASLSERDRLSWHTYVPGMIQDYNQVPIGLFGGWRAGTYYGLNGSTDWDRVVLTADATVVPEPASVLLMGFGAIALVAIANGRRRWKRLV